MSMQDLQAKMQNAMAANDVKAIEEVASEIVKGKSERRKADLAVIVKENEALAGSREALAEEIRKAVNQIPDITSTLAGLKANGFTYHRKGELDSNGVEQTKSSVGLLVPSIKKSKSGGNGGAGKTKTEYGMSLTEVFDKFANDEDNAKLADAEAKDKEASEKLGKSTNSNGWRVKNDVKKAAIAAGLLAPVK